MNEILEGLRALQNRMSRLEVGESNNLRRSSRNVTLDVAFGCTQADVRNHRNPAIAYIKLKEARNMIPEIDGSSRIQVQKFLTASTYAMKEIKSAEEGSC